MSDGWRGRTTNGGANDSRSRRPRNCARSDATGAVVPNASVVVSDASTNFSRTTTTNESGFFTVTNLPVGKYNVLVEAPNFKKAVRTAIDLSADGKLTLDFTLETGQVTETVEVVQQSGETVNTTSGEVGKVIDNFAPDKVANYINPEAGSAQKSQWITGFDFDYRLYGGSSDGVRVWIQGETMHGVRTADIDCKPKNDPNEIPPVCRNNASVQDRVRFILENASSVEAWVRPRVEFLKVQRDSDSPAWLYATANVGFLALKEAPKVYRTMHVGLGLLAYDGNFAESFVEAGWGSGGTADLDAVRAAVDDAAAIVVQHPSFLGTLEEVAALAEIAHGAAAKLVVHYDLTSSGILESPGAHTAGPEKVRLALFAICSTSGRPATR